MASEQSGPMLTINVTAKYVAAVCVPRGVVMGLHLVPAFLLPPCLLP